MIQAEIEVLETHCFTGKKRGEPMIYLGIHRSDDYDLVEVRRPETAYVIMRMALIGLGCELPPVPDFLDEDIIIPLVAYADSINAALGRPQFTIDLEPLDFDSNCVVI